MKPSTAPLLVIFSLLLPVAAFMEAKAAAAKPPYPSWWHTGALAILTTPDGADLPESASVEQFPLLVRLQSDWFDFSQAMAHGEDVRFSSQSGESLAFEIDNWDAAKGTASIWVRVPRITGNSVQALRMHWGKPDATGESNAKAVFNESNGFLSVWHMGNEVRDVTGTLETKDTGTTPAAGVVGEARHFAGQQGVFGGDQITTYPTGEDAHSSGAWVRAEQPNSTIIGWGNEKAQGKVVMHYKSPPHVRVDCYFSDGNVEGKSPIPLGTWNHVVHTYRKGESVVYVNGVMDAVNTKGPPMAITSPARLWIGGWYNRYDFLGGIDEVRVSKVTRPAEWVRLEYENQKPLNTLVGPLVQAGNAFAVSPEKVVVDEGESVTFAAQAGGARKVCWLLIQDGHEEVVATDRFHFKFTAGRVPGVMTAVLRFKAVCADGVKTKDIPITVRKKFPQPEFTLRAPTAWDGRAAIEVVPQLTNLAAMKEKGVADLTVSWSVGPFAVIQEATPEKLILKRAQNSGKLTVTAKIGNGGAPVTQSVVIDVTEPQHDAWMARVPAKDERPEEGQFYARDDQNEGTLHYSGTLTESADSVFLKLYADDKLVKSESAKPGTDNSYALSVKLKPGLIKYRIEFGTLTGGKEMVRDKVPNLVCGDAFLIDGQSNALATDTREESPPETNEWIRSYGRPSQNPKENEGNLWCNPVWKARNGEKAELGWWGMQLAKQLLESQKVPIFIINGAVGGTRIDQHQRNTADPTDLDTIYGRMLWRLQRAELTHGIRGILWHQGENDQGSDGPTGGYGWETYQPLFVEMAAAWKQDFPNVRHYYVFQIWPNSCSMGGSDGAGDRLREKQRTLPQLFANMSIMSTLGVRPPGGCHYPLAGWSEFARMIQPLIERDFYGKTPAASITPPNLRRAWYPGAAKDAISLEFDQPVVWNDALAGQFYLDGQKDKIASGSVSGDILTLKLKKPSTATLITYLKEVAWNQDTLLVGENGIAALTFCEVPIEK
jgi:hypothetical protein